MKKILVLMISIFLIFSINGFSQDKHHKKAQSGKIEQPKNGKHRTKPAPGKSVSKKTVHKPTPKGHGPKKSGKAVKV
jgi:hypothetical protein